MHTKTEHSRESGVAGLIVLGVVLLALVAVAFFLVMRAQDKDEEIGTQMNTPLVSSSSGGESRFQKNAKNTQRANDVSSLLGAASEFINNNSGNMPIGFEDGAFVGASADAFPAKVSLHHYATADVVTGEQPPLTSDTLRLVTGAACAEDGGTITAPRRSFVAQYVFQDTASSGFIAKCKES